MTKSFTYYLTMLVIKLKGIKKSYSQDPIDYVAIRKEDVHFPKNKFFKSSSVNNYQVGETIITEVKQQHSAKLLIWIHGGAFIAGPAQHHWDTIERIAQQTDCTIWLCNYPKAPEHKINQISGNIDSVYDFALKTYNSNDITLIGDSVGGTLIITLVQRLIFKEQEKPAKLILISPVLDASFENPKIKELDKTDPILSKSGVLSAKKMCNENEDLKNVSISPIYGSFQNFPMTYLFLAENDITYPDQLIMWQKFKSLDIEHYVFIGKGMPHIWPLLPVMKEAKESLNEIIKILKRCKIDEFPSAS